MRKTSLIGGMLGQEMGELASWMEVEAHVPGRAPKPQSRGSWQTRSLGIWWLVIPETVAGSCDTIGRILGQYPATG